MNDRALPDPRYCAQRGIALITCMLILVMLTLLGLSMFRGTGLQQKIAGNTREKARAYEAAENALQFGEYYLVNGNPATGVQCANKIIVAGDTDLASMQTCTTTLATPADPTTWPTLMSYTPPPMKVAAGGGTMIDGNGNLDVNYAKVPGLYIAYLGLAPDGQQMLYSVTGVGYGGSSSSTAVVQSVYATQSNVTVKDGL